jgi:lambda family phage portal protein
MARKSKTTVTKAVAKYDAAGSGRRLKGWSPSSSGPNLATQGLQKIRDRSRDTSRNDWSGQSAARIYRTALVGTGIVARPKTKDLALKKKLTVLWDAWSKSSDADGIWDFNGLQAMVVNSWFESGEVFARIRPRRPEDGLEVPIQVQLLEADLVPLLDTDSWPGLPSGSIIRQGIEISRIGKRTAYWMYKSHPGDKFTGSPTHNDLVRVPSEFVMHIFEPSRPGQLRGVSTLAPVLTKLRGVMDFDDAVLERQKLANLFTMFITKALPTSVDGIDPITGNAVVYDSDGGGIAGLEPGTSYELMSGEDVRFSDPPDAGANYAEFMRKQTLGVAAGAGIPHELHTGDIKDVSDRALRVIVNEFRRMCEQKQWLVVIPMFCQRVRDAWATAAVLSGALLNSELADAKDVRWSPQGWQYIHPVQDVEAKKVEVESGFRSRASVIAERGEDPDEVDQERADDIARSESLGLDPLPGVVKPAVPAPEPAEATETPPDNTVRNPTDVVRFDRNDAAIKTISAKLDRLSNRPEFKPVDMVDSFVRMVEAMPKNEPSNVTVNAPIEISQPKIENVIQPSANTIVPMPAPEVHITNEVQPSDTTVNVNLPTRVTETTVVRDADGRITSATQTESDA